jgi:hypothetical protein
VLNHNLLVPVTNKDINAQTVKQKIANFQQTSQRNWSLTDFNLSKISKYSFIKPPSHVTISHSPTKKYYIARSRAEIQKPFYKNLETMKYGWKDARFDLTCYNKGSTNYDIINQSPKKLFDKVECRHPKGFTEFIELNRLHATNFQKQYSSVQNLKVKTFGLVNGIAMDGLEGAKSYGPMFNRTKV